MQTTLIMLPQPILVSDEEPKNIVYVNNHIYKHEIRRFTLAFGNSNVKDCKEIIAGVHDLPKLDLSAIAEEIGWVDVERLAYKQLPIIPTFDKGEIINSDTNFFIRLGWMEGFKAAQSLNEKKFTLSEMEQCWLQAQECVLGTDDFPMGGNNFKYPSFKEYIHSLSKPKEYNVECIQKGNTIKVTKIL